MLQDKKPESIDTKLYYSDFAKKIGLSPINMAFFLVKSTDITILLCLLDADMFLISDPI
jgi:hypothetical protein